MLQIKFMLFAVVALTIVNSAVAIIGGHTAAPKQYPYFALLETFKNPQAPVILLWSFFHVIDELPSTRLNKINSKFYCHSDRFNKIAVEQSFQISGL